MKPTLFLFLFLLPFVLPAQKQPLNYFLPDVTYNPAIPTPESVLGYQVGEWHASHDQLLNYIRTLASKSDRMTLQEYGRSHENRPLVYLTITSPANLKRIEEIRKEHLRLSDPGVSASINTANMPAVVYLGYSIHGNEPSGANASMLVAYYLAAAQTKEVEEMLNHTVILLDPSFNPDGLNRFASWVNTHKSKNLSSDPADREFNEAWPGGRTNHYWFDLNRDWLFTQQPESQGRIRFFHQWNPNVLTDHHEMGTNGTFFFQPGIPTSVNTITPPENQQLTEAIAKYHVKALDKIGSQYYSRESFDDFYAGKGSTYTDLNGCIGILFEQASSRGHLQESINGLLSFPFTIRNHVTASLSTLQAVQDLRTQLLDYQRSFYKTALEQGHNGELGAYLIAAPSDPARLAQFVELLRRHEIHVYALASDLKTEKGVFKKGDALIVPLEQTQNRVVRVLFETQKSYTDSVFYDISTWTLPLAFDLDYIGLKGKDFSNSLLGTEITASILKEGSVVGAPGAYGYVFSWSNYYAPKALGQILKAGLRAKVASKPFEIAVDGKSQSFSYGTIFVPVQDQNLNASQMYDLMRGLSRSCYFDIYALSSGRSEVGLDMGSPSMSALREPKTLMLIGNGVNPNDAGEEWHLFDQRYGMPLNAVDLSNFGQVQLDRYNTIILPDGNYSALNSPQLDNLKAWIQKGGVVVAFQNAVNWLQSKELANVVFKTIKKDSTNKDRKLYENAANEKGGNEINGIILESQLDLSHPLCYGYTDRSLGLLHTGTNFMELSQNPYANPLIYSKEPLMSGYLSRTNQESPRNAAGVVVSALGAGRVICFSDNPAFRAVWLGGNKLVANAVFFGNIISSLTTETNVKKE